MDIPHLINVFSNEIYRIYKHRTNYYILIPLTFKNAKYSTIFNVKLTP
jgi:hypothetical protein